MNESATIDNPFTPTFGEVPACMAGRGIVLNDFRRAFASAKRHPNLTTAITGARGSGKTALLSLAAEEAERRGWIAVQTVAMDGMLDDILISARRAAAHVVSSKDSSRMSGFEIGGVLGVDWEREPRLTNWRNEMTLLLDELGEASIGLLIAVDEVQPKLEEMVRLAAVYQLFVTEGRKVSLLMAGLPHNMLALEKDKTVSFLRRAQKCRLGRIADFEVADAMRRTIEESGRSIDSEALGLAVRAADGFPFMMQLVGFRMWDRSPNHHKISLQDVEEGANLANAELKDRIVKVTYDSLSRGDKAFLAALAHCDEGATSAEIAKRMGKTPSYATQYKNRLLGQGVIEESPAGILTFQLPLMREYVIESQ